MEITYGGDARFKLAGSRTVSINGEPGDKSDISLFTRRQRGSRLRINGPGEYEISDVLIVTVPVGPSKSERWAHGVTLDDTRVLYLEGEVDALTETALLAIGPVDVLIIEAAKLPAAVKAAQDLTPRVVVPFGPHAAELCAALGVKDAAPIARLSLNGKTPKAVLLKAPRTARKRTAA
jgi:hypothetical protein